MYVYIYIYIYIYRYISIHFSNHLYNAESFIIIIIIFFFFGGGGGHVIKAHEHNSWVLMNQTNLSVIKLSLFHSLPGYTDHLMHGSSLYFPVFSLC